SSLSATSSTALPIRKPTRLGLPSTTSQPRGMAMLSRMPLLPTLSPARFRAYTVLTRLEDCMHTIKIPQSVIDRVIEKRGREHIYEDMDPAKTALVVVDMQNAFMLPGVAHALCPMAQNIVPAINRLAQAVRATGGTVVWIKTTF